MAEIAGNATATVLFSDLVGSTELLAKLGEAGFDEFRRQHFQVLRAAIGQHHGREIKTTGDGILAVFASAADALSCAVAMQQAVHRPAGTGRPPVAIRVGLALGDVVFEDHDVFGIPVVQAARLTATADAGQILTTATVTLVAGGRASVRWTDLEPMTLKGLPEPIAVCEVPWEPHEAAVVPDVVAGVEFRLLGAIEVAVGGRVIEIGGVKLRALLAMMALHQNTVVSTDALIEALWGQHPPPSARSMLRSLVAQLRRIFEDAVSGEAVLRAKGRGYVLKVDPRQVDALRFSALVDRARDALGRDQVDMAARDLRASLALWRGPALADLPESGFARTAAQRLNEQRLSAVEDLAEAELRLARPAEALTHLESLVAAHPLRQRAWGQLMLARYRLGCEADALAGFQKLRTVLADELGIDPCPALRELHERILRQDPRLDHQPPLPISERDGNGRAADSSSGDEEPISSRPDPAGIETKFRASPRTKPVAQASHRTKPVAQASHRHNLPVALTTFVGRANELADLDALLDEARLITLSGPGGAGKTRMALQCARDALARYREGVRFVEFASIRDPALVVPTTTTAIGLIPSELEATGKPLLEALSHQLADRRLLLVLDNCEHLIEPISGLVHSLLVSCAHMTVLATSREGLGVAGELIYAVPPLSAPRGPEADPDRLGGFDAVRLFCERARLAAPAFRLTDANAEAVSLICRQVDGLPLALELAAARTRVLSVHQVAERLTDRLRLLGSGIRSVARHQTLRAAIDWSYELLSPDEQALLAELSVFPSSFDLDAVEAIASGATGSAGVEALDLLAHLVDKSLVVAFSDGDRVRYRLLEIIRDYAGEKLANDQQREALHRRHRDFFMAIAENHPLGIVGWARRIRRAAADLDNFRAALTWSRARGDGQAVLRIVAMLWVYWETTGAGEGLDWLEQAVAVRGPTLRSAQAEVQIGLAWALRNRGAVEGKRFPEPLIEEALETAVNCGHVNTVGQCSLWLFERALGTGELDRAEYLAHQALSSFRACGSSQEQGISHHHLGWLHIYRREYSQAHEHLQIALELVQTDEWALAQVLAALALASALSGRIADAERFAKDGVGTARRLPTCQSLVMALTRAAQASVLSGHAETARSALPELLQALHDLGFQRWVADAVEMTAVVLVSNRPAHTAVLLGASRSLRQALNETTPAFISEDIERCRHQAAQALGTQQCADQEQQGGKMTSRKAVAFALHALEGQYDGTGCIV